MKAKCDVIKQSFGGVYWKIKSIVARHYSLTQTNQENTVGLFQWNVTAKALKKV